MKSILIATNNKQAIASIRECLGGEYEVETARDRKTCQAKFLEKRYELLFMDIGFLAKPEADNRVDYSPAQELW